MEVKYYDFYSSLYSLQDLAQRQAYTSMYLLSYKKKKKKHNKNIGNIPIKFKTDLETRGQLILIN